jgi:hypothetical protein
MIFKSQTPFECALKFITQLKTASSSSNQDSTVEYFYPHFPFIQSLKAVAISKQQIFSAPQNPKT